MIAITVASDSYDVPSNAADQNWAAKQVAFEQALAGAINSALASIATLSAPLTWSAVGFLNDWADAATYQACEYAKGVDGTVYLRGAAMGGSDAIMFMLPSGFWPPGKNVFSVAISNASGLLTVNSDGTVSIEATGGGDETVLTSLSGVNFSTL